MIAVRAYGRGSVTEVATAAISEEIEKPGCLVWVDVEAPTDDDLDALRDEFALHPLALEDVRERHQRAKLEHYPDHAFVVAYSAQLQEVNVFVGPAWVISVRHPDDEGRAWDCGAARARFERRRTEEVSTGFLLYTILDVLVDEYFEATDRFEDSLEDLEECVFASTLPSERDVQQDLFRARRQLLLFRRAVVPLREVVTALLRDDVAWIDRATAVQLQDVYDHVLRVVELLDLQRELLGNTVDAHLAIISNGMNRVVKRLTAWGAILLGATLVAGIYGMNFENMPELDWEWGYPWALGLMATLTVVGYRYFRAKDWL